MGPATSVRARTFWRAGGQSSAQPCLEPHQRRSDPGLSPGRKALAQPEVLCRDRQKPCGGVATEQGPGQPQQPCGRTGMGQKRSGSHGPDPAHPDLPGLADRGIYEDHSGRAADGLGQVGGELMTGEDPNPGASPGGQVFSHVNPHAVVTAQRVPVPDDQHGGRGSIGPPDRRFSPVAIPGGVLHSVPTRAPAGASPRRHGSNSSDTDRNSGSRVRCG